jgi:hypothetical protein
LERRAKEVELEGGEGLHTRQGVLTKVVRDATLSAVGALCRRELVEEGLVMGFGNSCWEVCFIISAGVTADVALFREKSSRQA